VLGLPLVPGYTVTREVARGGMGVVYRAYDPTFEREVAVKVMHAGQDAGRFVIESKVTAQLPHPGIPPVHELGTLGDGRPFLAMKLIEGRTLSDELRASSRADLPRLLNAFEQICQTVGFAHARGIIHRDLKPANVMVGAFGEVLVMDWGLAKAVPGSRFQVPSEDAERVAAPQRGVDETQAGQIKGTPAYMAPEQARGEQVDARADVFALGGILCAILTGKAPFSGNAATDTVKKAAAAELNAAFARLDGCGVDEELVAVAKRCLAADLADRYANGEEAGAAVASYRAGVEDRLRQAEAAGRVLRARNEETITAHRRLFWRTLTVFAAFAVLAVGVGFVFWDTNRQKLADGLRDGKQRVEVQEDLATVKRREAQLLLADAEKRMATVEAAEVMFTRRKAAAVQDAEKQAVRIAILRVTQAIQRAGHIDAVIAACEEATRSYPNESVFQKELLAARMVKAKELKTKANDRLAPPPHEK